MKTFSIKEALKRGWDLFTKHWVTLLLLGVMFVILGAIQEMFDKDMYWFNPIAWIVMIASIIVQILVQIGATKLLLNIEDGREVELMSVFSHKNLFWKYIGASILCSVMIMVGLVLLIIPGLYLFSRFGFTLTALVDRNLGIKEAFKASSDMTEGMRLKVLGFVAVIILLNILGAIPFGLGLVISIPVTALAWMHVYRTLSRAHSQPVEAA